MKKLLTFAVIILGGLFSTSLTHGAVNVYVHYSANPCMTSTLDTRLVDLSWFTPNNQAITYDVYFGNMFVTSTTTGGYYDFFVTAANCTATNGTWKVVQKTNGLPADSGTVVVKVTPPAISRPPVVTPALSYVFLWLKPTLTITSPSSCDTYKWFKSTTGTGNWTQVANAFGSTYKASQKGFYYAEISDGQTASQSANVQVKALVGCAFRTANQTEPTEVLTVSSSNRSMFAVMEEAVSYHVRITNMLGQVVFDGQVYPDTEVSLDSFKEGVYVITTASGINQKLIISK